MSQTRRWFAWRPEEKQRLKMFKESQNDHVLRIVSIYSLMIYLSMRNRKYRQSPVSLSMSQAICTALFGLILSCFVQENILNHW